MANLNSENMNRLDSSALDSKNKSLVSDNSIEKMTHEVGKKIGAVASDMAKTTTDYVQTGKQYVQGNPTKSLAIAVAAGAFAGSILTLAMRRRH